MDDELRSDPWRRIVRATWQIGVIATVVVVVVIAASKHRDTREARDRPEGELWRLAKVELSWGGDPYTEVIEQLEVSLRPEAAPSEGRSVPNTEPPDRFSHHSHAHQLGIHCLLCHTNWSGASVVAPWSAHANNACANCHRNEPERADGAAAARRRWFVVRRDADKSPKEIDLTECDASGQVLPGATVRRGIYDEGPDSLRIALTFGPVAADFRPKSFEPASLTPGPAEKVAGVAVLHLTR